VPIIIITIIIAPAATGSSFGHKLARLRQQHSGFPGRAGDQITEKRIVVGAWPSIGQRLGH
jgi:hypothetical protein